MHCQKYLKLGKQELFNISQQRPYELQKVIKRFSHTYKMFVLVPIILRFQTGSKYRHLPKKLPVEKNENLKENDSK